MPSHRTLYSLNNHSVHALCMEALLVFCFVSLSAIPSDALPVHRGKTHADVHVNAGLHESTPEDPAAETGHRYSFFDPPDPTRRIHPKTDHIKEILKLSRLDSFSESSTTSRSRFRSLISDFLGLAESARADGSQGQLILEISGAVLFSVILCTVAYCIYVARKSPKEKSPHGGIVNEAPARRSWLAKIFGRTQPDRTSSEHVALIEQAAQTPRRSSLLAEADVHVTARPIHALTSPTAEAEQISRVVEPPAAARAAADDDLPPHVVGRAADELFPQPIATQQPPSPQSPAPAKPFHGAAKSASRPTFLRTPSMIKNAGGSMIRTPKGKAPGTGCTRTEEA